LLDHQRLRALVARLDQNLSRGATDASLMRELADQLENHIRLEERRLLPLVEELVPEALGRLDLAGPHTDAEAVVDLLALVGRGPLWGTETVDLNATLLVWDANAAPPEHVNPELDGDGSRLASRGCGTCPFTAGEPRSRSPRWRAAAD
jgi:Hemerythrin HHE cation binding domain